MSRLIWTRKALIDIQRCHRFLADKNPVVANQAMHSIRESMRTVKAHPAAGRPVSSLDSGYREWLIPFGSSGYVALYRTEGDRIVVLAVKHQREAGYS